jgi:hypothetical protein
MGTRLIVPAKHLALPLRGAGQFLVRIPRVPLRSSLGYFRCSLWEHEAGQVGISRVPPSPLLRSGSGSSLGYFRRSLREQEAGQAR